MEYFRLVTNEEFEELQRKKAQTKRRYNTRTRRENEEAPQADAGTA